MKFNWKMSALVVSVISACISIYYITLLAVLNNFITLPVVLIGVLVLTGLIAGLVPE